MKHSYRWLSLLLLFACSPAFAQAFSIGTLLTVVIYLVIVGLIFWVIWWFVGYVGVPEPFNKVIRVVIGLVALLVVVYLLLALLPPLPGAFR